MRNDPPRLGQRVTVGVHNEFDDTTYTVNLRWDRDERGAGWFMDDCDPWPDGLSAETSVHMAASKIADEVFSGSSDD